MRVPVRAPRRVVCALSGLVVAAVLSSGSALPGAAALPVPVGPVPGPAAGAVSARVLAAELRAGTLSRSAGVVDICARQHLACVLKALTAAGSTTPLATSTPVGYGADDLQRAYGISTPAPHAGIVVVVGAGASAGLDHDLSVYRSTFHLPPCPLASGCLQQRNFVGGPAYGPAAPGTPHADIEKSVAVETALDVEMVSAGCPNCRIISLQVPVEDAAPADTDAVHRAAAHFAQAVATAVQLGAAAVSISYAYPSDGFTDSYGMTPALMTQRGTAVVASSGDDGLNLRAPWPQNLPTVTSVGGTSLYVGPGGRGWVQTAWSRGGSGCAGDEPPPANQPAAVSALCGVPARAASDISAVADPYTGVAEYTTALGQTGPPTGWLVIGGTSVSAPLIAAMYARNYADLTQSGPNTLYAAPASVFQDVTVGANARPNSCPRPADGPPSPLCTAGPGWDGPTGLGTPVGDVTFTPRVSLVDVATGACAAIAAPAHGTPAATAACTASTTRFTPTFATGPRPRQSATVRIGSLCLDIAYESQANGASVVSGVCTKHPSQTWQFVAQSGGTYLLVNTTSGRCLDIAYHRRDVGAPLVQGACDGSAFQRWRLASTPAPVISRAGS